MKFKKACEIFIYFPLFSFMILYIHVHTFKYIHIFTKLKVYIEATTYIWDKACRGSSYQVAKIEHKETHHWGEVCN